MPKWLIPLGLILTVAALVPVALIARARNDNQTTTRINLIPDMDYQPRYRAQDANSAFVDGRAMREWVDGTVARGELAEDDHLNLGRVDGAWATEFPMEVTSSVMARGQQRFEIYCAPCHGVDGMGQGLVNSRALELMDLGNANWVQALSIHDETVREREVGHLYNTITYGIRTMPAYGSQISVEDRWAIVAYLRALQRSSRATLDDVPRDVLPTLQ